MGRAHGIVLGDGDQAQIRIGDEDAVEEAAQHLLVVQVGLHRHGIGQPVDGQLRGRRAQRLLQRHDLGRQHHRDALGVGDLGVEHRALAALLHGTQHQHDRERDAGGDQHEARQRKPDLERAAEIVQTPDHWDVPGEFESWRSGTPAKGATPASPGGEAVPPGYSRDIIRRRFCVWSM